MMKKKKHFNREFVMNKEADEGSENSTYVDGDVKVRDHCHVTEKYRGSIHRDCNLNI